MRLRRYRLASWLAILAMSLNALWPLLAQAKPRSVTLVPVCTIAGETHYIELPAGKTPLEQKSSVQGEHCSFCTLSALPPALVLVASEKASAARVAHFAALPAEAPLFFSARPRAPPLLQSMNVKDDYDWRTHEEDSALRHRGARAVAADAG